MKKKTNKKTKEKKVQFTIPEFKKICVDFDKAKYESILLKFLLDELKDTIEDLIEKYKGLTKNSHHLMQLVRPLPNQHHKEK